MRNVVGCLATSNRNLGTNSFRQNQLCQSQPGTKKLSFGRHEHALCMPSTKKALASPAKIRGAADCSASETSFGAKTKVSLHFWRCFLLDCCSFSVQIFSVHSTSLGRSRRTRNVTKMAFSTNTNKKWINRFINNYSQFFVIFHNFSVHPPLTTIFLILSIFLLQNRPNALQVTTKNQFTSNVFKTSSLPCCILHCCAAEQAA